MRAIRGIVEPLSRICSGIRQTVQILDADSVCGTDRQSRCAFFGLAQFEQSGSLVPAFGTRTVVVEDVPAQEEPVVVLECVAFP